MVPLRFDRSRVQALLERAGDRLVGDWLLIGGGAAAAWFSPDRTTEDIDLIGLAGTQDERFALMQLALDSDIPVEAVNSAADFFVRRVPGWRDNLVQLVRGSSATIYRPNATLFLLLKLERLTAVDLDDCLALLVYCEGTGELTDRSRIHARLEELVATEDEALRDRRQRLRDALS